MKKLIVSFFLLGTSFAYAAKDNAVQKPLPSAHDEMHLAMESMCKGMEGMKMTGSIDHDFLLMMVPHHQSALEMAKAYLREGVAPEIREMAQKIIDAQNKEISEMEAWLKEHPLTAESQAK